MIRTDPRRDWRRGGAWRLATLAVWACLAAPAWCDRTIVLVVDAPLSAPVQHAVADLTRTLGGRGWNVREASASGAAHRAELVIGLADGSKEAARLAQELGVRIPSQPESLGIRRFARGTRRGLLFAGRDARGLAYAILDAARDVELAAPDADPLQAIGERIESPDLFVRSVTIQCFNADVESEWYDSEEFWRGYFAMLARNRFNHFTLTFGHQTNYRNPVYPFLVEVPEHPQVRGRGLGEAQRDKNLAMLRRIAELAAERGLDFTLGIWSQRPVPTYGPVEVEGLPDHPAQAADYCARALQKLLRACPAITGVQFRMNRESGVDEAEQAEYFQVQFEAIQGCGRPVRLDLRYKGLGPRTIDAAAKTGLDLTVSTKFWCEHMGLPFHPTAEDTHYRQDRYGYGAMLGRPHPYRVVYRLWNVGTQRLLLWGDPEYAARFAASCSLGGGEGFEVFAPLTNKGFGNAPGRWQIFDDRSYAEGTWEYERYWLFYLLFGRLGYDRQAGPEIWRRELRHRFGPAALDVERAYAHASRILPLITAARLPSASEWHYWPEMDTGGSLEAYARAQPSDPAQFYAIRSWRKVPSWQWEEWDERRGFVEDALEDTLQGKWTPIQVSQELTRLADATLEALRKAQDARVVPPTAALRSTVLDCSVLAHLARYHAEKSLAATQHELFLATGQAGRLTAALRHIRRAAGAWDQIVRATDGVYHPNLVFGRKVHTGHWKDRAEEVRADVTYLERLVRERGGPAAEAKDQEFGPDFPPLPGEIPPARPIVIEHTPVRTARPKQDLPIEVRVESETPVRAVLLHHRRLDQTADWQVIRMDAAVDGRYRGVVPAAAIQPDWDHMYYLEVRTDGGGRLWPSWQQEQPYIVVATDLES